MTWLLNPKSSDFGIFFLVHDSRCVGCTLGYGIFHPVAFSLVLQIRFWERSQFSSRGAIYLTPNEAFTLRGKMNVRSDGLSIPRPRYKMDIICY